MLVSYFQYALQKGWWKCCCMLSCPAGFGTFIFHFHWIVVSSFHCFLCNRFFQFWKLLITLHEHTVILSHVKKMLSPPSELFAWRVLHRAQTFRRQHRHRKHGQQ
jgi:hypothetical protein